MLRTGRMGAHLLQYAGMGAESVDWMYLVYFLLGALCFGGARLCGRGSWNEEYTSLRQTKALQGLMALCIALHHMAQKTCAPWHQFRYIVHGLDFFVPIGYIFVGVFLFCSGLGLYRSLKAKPDYLKGFVRHRILPVVAAFYLSEFIHLAVRLLMGEKMSALDVIWYLSGLHMANPNAWYVIVIPFFYLAFYLAFRYSRSERAAILWVTAFTLAYTLLGTCIDPQNDWWMRGSWWYNSILLFPLGLLFGRHEARITAFFKKGYWGWLVLFFAAIFLLYQLSLQVTDNWKGHYWESVNDPLKIPFRLCGAASQWLVCIAFVGFCFLLLMKLRFGNRLLSLLGSVTLAFYLMHGLFVELFGYNFMDIGNSLVYIKNVPLYMLAVLAGSALGTFLFQLLWKAVTRWIRQGARR